MSSGTKPSSRMSPTSSTSRSRFVWLSVFLVSLVSLTLSLAATRNNTPTIDEFSRLPAAVYYVETGNLGFDNSSPSLIKLLSGLPAKAASARLDLPPEVVDQLNQREMDPRLETYRSLAMGQLFHMRNRENYDRIFFWARVPIALCGAVLVGLIAFWSSQLFGVLAGLLSGMTAALCPNLLAHSGLVTGDVPLALFWTLTLFFLWQTARRPRWTWTLATGLALGLVLLTKYSALVLLGLVPLSMLLVVVLRRPDPEEEKKPKGLNTRWKPFYHSLLAVVLALIVVGIPYKHRRVLQPPNFLIKSRLVRNFSWVPMPLPETYVAGLDGMLSVLERGNDGYLNGQHYVGSRWYYYPEAFLLKVPTATLALGLLALLASWPVLRRPGPALVLVAVPTAVFLFINMFLGSVNIGLRYILPVFPAFFIGLGVFLRSGKWFKPRLVLAGCLLLVLTVVIVGNCPFYLGYFNRIAGGRDGGPRYLLDSNIDWGQDLKRLADFLHQRDIDSVTLAYFGQVPMEHYGIRVTSLEPTPLTRGWIAVSAHLLYGMPYRIYGLDQFAWLREREPVARIGGSIYVFNLDDSEGDR